MLRSPSDLRALLRLLHWTRVVPLMALTFIVTVALLLTDASPFASGIILGMLGGTVAAVLVGGAYAERPAPPTTHPAAPRSAPRRP